MLLITDNVEIDDAVSRACVCQNCKYIPIIECNFEC